MPIDVNVITQELSNLLQSVYKLQQNLYDMYLDDVPKQVPIEYVDINNNLVTVNIDNVAKLQEKFNNIENTLIEKCSYINILKNVEFTDTTGWDVTFSNVTYTIATQDLTTDDKIAISTIIGTDVFTSPNAIQPSYMKLVINISTPGNRSDFRIGQSATTIGLSIWHPDSFVQEAFINPNGVGWTRDISQYTPTTKTAGYPFELEFGDLYIMEIFFPVLYPVYNKGLVPSLL